MVDKEKVLDLIEELQDFALKEEKTWSEAHVRDAEEKITDRCNYGKSIAARIILREIGRMHEKIYMMDEQ